MEFFLQGLGGARSDHPDPGVLLHNGIVRICRAYFYMLLLHCHNPGTV